MVTDLIGTCIMSLLINYLVLGMGAGGGINIFLWNKLNQM
ncbi:MAG: hypothetical protein ACI9H6_000880 [Patiriisocius sp.]|jgi:hypothetical protein